MRYSQKHSGAHYFGQIRAIVTEHVSFLRRSTFHKDSGTTNELRGCQTNANEKENLRQV